MAAAVNLIYEPLDMVPGGISGAAILIRHFTAGYLGGWLAEGIPVGLSNIVLNIPIFIAAWRDKGGPFIKRTLLANMWFSFMLFLIPVAPVTGKDYLLAGVVGGVLTGVGLGMIFLTETSTGGTDLLAVVVNRYVKNVSVAQILFAIDSLIVIAGAFVFGVDIALYAVIAVYVASKLMDTVAEGLQFSKLALVISEQYQEISHAVIEEMQRGNTVLDVQGMYSSKPRKMLMCVMGKKETGQFLSIIEKYDRQAFVIVTDAREVLGEGFVEFP